MMILATCFQSMAYVFKTRQYIVLHSYANPAHEQRTGELPREMLPGAFVSLSVDMLPQKLEYERASTTVINAYVGPPVKHYVRSMVSRIQRAGIGGRLMVM